MPSQTYQSQASQQQAGSRSTASTSRSAANTSRLRTGNGAVSQQGSSSFQRGSRTEPNRLSSFSPAPSTISPSDSASCRGSDAGSSRNTPQSGTRGQASGELEQLSGPQVPQDISIGAPYGAPMHFHYNQVDNRQLQIHNNAPQNVVTNNNHMYNTDNSNHHNVNTPYCNRNDAYSTNSGNCYNDGYQQAPSVRQPVGGSSYGTQYANRPSEDIPIRDREFKTVKHVKIPPSFLIGKRKATYESVPDDRPC